MIFRRATRFIGGSVGRIRGVCFLFGAFRIRLRCVFVGGGVFRGERRFEFCVLVLSSRVLLLLRRCWREGDVLFARTLMSFLCFLRVIARKS